MSKIKTRLEKLASIEEYGQYVTDIANLSDDLENILNNVKNNEQLYSIIMADDQKFKAFHELLEINKSIGYILLQL